MYKRQVQEGLIRTNPAVGCKLPPKRGREMQVLGREELQRFLIQAQAEGYFELFLPVSYTHLDVYKRQDLTMDENRHRHTVWMDDDVWDQVESHYQRDNCTTCLLYTSRCV